MVRPAKFDIEDSTAGSAVTVSIAGELDMNTAQTLSQRLDERLNGAVTDLTLDLRDISFMDSSGLRLLIELNDRCTEQAWRLQLIPPRHETAALVLRATGADTALPFNNDAGS